jgi:Flp pilus assembly pilin Flp
MLSRLGSLAAKAWSSLGHLTRDAGQTLTEYALIIAIMSIGLTASLAFLRDELDTFFRTAIDKF